MAALLAVWLAAASVGARAGDGARFASAGTATYAYGQVARIPSELRDQRAFARAAEQDPLRAVPAGDLLTGLRGKDVLLVFVESYGRVAVQGSSFSPGVDRVLDDGTRRLAGARVRRPQRVPHLADVRRRSAGSRTRRCSPGCGSTASSATTRW